MKARPTGTISETKAQSVFRGCDYKFCLLPEEAKPYLEKKDTSTLLKMLEANHFYVSAKDNKEFQYVVISEMPQNRKIKQIKIGAIEFKSLSATLEVKLPLTVKQLEPFLLNILDITSEINHTCPNNLAFTTWYDPITFSRLRYLLDKPYKRQEKPYIMVDGNPLVVLKQLRELKENIKQKECHLQTFIVKPEIGAAHFYGGIVFRDGSKQGCSLILFNPLGVPSMDNEPAITLDKTPYIKIADFLDSIIYEIKENSKIEAPWFNNIYLTTNVVQSVNKDKGRLVSCGPISWEFVNYIYSQTNASNDWVSRLVFPSYRESILKTLKTPSKSFLPDSTLPGVIYLDLAPFGMLSPSLRELMVATAVDYETMMLSLRQKHYLTLNKITTQDAFDNSEQAEVLGFGKSEREKAIEDIVVGEYSSCDELSSDEDNIEYWEEEDNEEDDDESDEDNIEYWEEDNEEDDDEAELPVNSDRGATNSRGDISSGRVSPGGSSSGEGGAGDRENSSEKSSPKLSGNVSPSGSITPPPGSSNSEDSPASEDDLSPEAIREANLEREQQRNSEIEKIQQKIVNELIILCEAQKKLLEKNALPFDKVATLLTKLKSPLSPEEKLRDFTTQFSTDEAHFAQDKTSSGRKFFKAVARLLLTILSLGKYSAKRETELNLTANTSHFWQSDQKLLGEKFIQRVKDKAPRELFPAPKPHGKKNGG